MAASGSTIPSPGDGSVRPVLAGHRDHVEPEVLECGHPRARHHRHTVGRAEAEGEERGSGGHSADTLWCAGAVLRVPERPSELGHGPVGRRPVGRGVERAPDRAMQDRALPDRAVMAASARRVLEAHWRDPGFTCPNASTYRWLWLWDSCFHSVVWAELGEAERAVRELEVAAGGRRP